jgi:cytochrome b subunit of formate dehydrogenase
VSCHEQAAAEVAGSLHDDDEFGPGCIDCHESHRVRRANSATCLTCHGEREFVHEHIEGEDVEAVLMYAESIHGDNIECSDCHAGHAVVSTDDPRSPVSHQNVATTCAQCHDDVAGEYLASEHGQALRSGFEGAPTCTDCHGEHDIHQITDSESPVSRQHEVEICESCHLDTDNVVARMTHTTGFVASYDNSVHGLAAAGGDADAAICSDCHGGHQAMKASSPNSRTNHFNISETCGQCHGEIEETFAGSIHGVALADGNADSPTCTTCHSEHAIADHTDADAPVAPLNVSEQVCRPCHESYKLSAKYGFASDRPSSFGDSYHGLATRFGSDESANCASCHGVHDILPSTDERSKVHPANLQSTCGTCHPGATANFAVGSVHVIRTPEGDALLYWITTIYILLIAVTIGSMGVHNGLDWFRKMVNHYHERLQRPTRGLPAVDGKRGLYVRMTVNERIQHALLAGSFILLTVTGFMLKFPDAWWVVFLRETFGVGVFDLRGIIHRAAAVVMVGDSVYHIYYVVFTERGRQFIRDILFRGQDFKDLVQMLQYYVGATKNRPQFDRFNYVEKSEYWALIWGTIVMTVTGIVLWFENQFMGQYSKLFVDINETIHYYEAWLAFLAIVVWHFYYVIFNPDVYPMNFTWLTGRITEEEMEHEHPLELKRIKAETESAGSSEAPESSQ